MSENKFNEFKELMRKHVGGERYNKMTDEELYDNAQRLLRLIELVESNENISAETI